MYPLSKFIYQNSREIRYFQGWLQELHNYPYIFNTTRFIFPLLPYFWGLWDEWNKITMKRYEIKLWTLKSGLRTVVKSYTLSIFCPVFLEATNWLVAYVQEQFVKRRQHLVGPNSSTLKVSHFDNWLANC